MSRLVAVLGALAVALPASARADEGDAAVRTRVAVAVDVDARTLTGRVGLELDNPTDLPLDRVYLWLYPNRHQRPPDGLDDVTTYWVYPRVESRGAMTVTGGELDDGSGPRPLGPVALTAEPHALAGDGALVSLALARPLAPGGHLRVALEFRADLPERFGWGCTGGGCLLPGGYYPMLAALDRGGFDLAAPPAVGTVEVSVTVAEPAALVLGGVWSGNGARALQVRATRVPYLPLVIAPELHESVRRDGGADLRVLRGDPPPPARDAQGQIVPYSLEDRAGFVLDTAAAGRRLLAGWAGLRSSALTVVEVPLRGELATAQPGVVLVSDRFFRIWPAEKFRKFHRRHLVRAVVAAELQPRLAAGGRTGVELVQASEAVGAHVAELYVLSEYARAEFLGQILRPISFIPAVDQLLYAPQTLFADAYFGGQADADPWRDDVRRFAGAAPRGRLLYDKLRDLLAPAALDRALRAVAQGHDRLADAAARAHGAPLDWFFRQWRHGAGRYGVRLVAARQRVQGRHFVAEVELERRVAPGDRAPIEPVVVEVIDRAGGRHRARWAGRGRRHTLRVTLPAPLGEVVVDPDGRLSEQKLPGEIADVRFDNVSEHPLRFVYNSFGVLLNLSDLSALLAADFSLARRHDLENGARFVLYSSASTRLGARIAYRRAFGRELTPDRLLGRAGLSLGVARLDSDFFAVAGEARPATTFAVTASLGGDSEVFLFEPLAKEVALGYATAIATRRDAGSLRAADTLVHLELGAVVSRTATPRLGHTLAAELSAAVALGELEDRSQLVTAGGAAGVRGYAPGARFGRALLLTRVEYRHAFVHDLDWNLGHYSFVRGFGGVAFADLALVAPCGSYDLAQRGALAATVGYGVQAFYDNFGTLPSVMRLDAALRLTGRGPRCLDAAPDEPTRLQIYLTFNPPF